MVQSKGTGKFYATVKKAFIPATFDEATCKALIGTQMEGRIIKEECTPYEYVNKETGEITMLTSRYIFTQEAEKPQRVQDPIYDNFLPNQDVFSKNGKHELAHA
jgi:hypothetical protein